MENFNIDSEEWKEKLKGKSPEEIAEIVGSYYREKYSKDRSFSPAKIIALLFFALIFILIFIIFLRLFSHLST
jgi:hypothetical protein